MMTCGEVPCPALRFSQERDRYVCDLAQLNTHPDRFCARPDELRRVITAVRIAMDTKENTQP